MLVIMVSGVGVSTLLVVDEHDGHTFRSAGAIAQPRWGHGVDTTLVIVTPGWSPADVIHDWTMTGLRVQGGPDLRIRYSVRHGDGFCRGRG